MKMGKSIRPGLLQEPGSFFDSFFLFCFMGWLLLQQWMVPHWVQLLSIFKNCAPTWVPFSHPFFLYGLRFFNSLWKRAWSPSLHTYSISLSVCSLSFSGTKLCLSLSMVTLELFALNFHVFNQQYHHKRGVISSYHI